MNIINFLTQKLFKEELQSFPFTNKKKERMFTVQYILKQIFALS